MATVQLKQLGDGSMGLEGVGLDAGAFVYLYIPYGAGAATTISGPIVNRTLQVQAITGLVDTAATNAVTATIVKATSATAISAGTALHSGTYNAQGTANTNQVLTVSATAGVPTIAAGSRVGINFSGSPGVAGAGVITLACTVA